MKKIAFIFPALLMLAVGFASCSDDDELPMVDINTTYTGATMVDGTLYVLQDQPFEITSVAAVPLREGAKVGLTSVEYGLDGWVIGVTNISPFGVAFEPGTFEVGKHLLSMRMGIVEEGCSPAVGYYATDFVVVATAEEIPEPSEGTEQGIINTHPSITSE
ncbi:hypothetical protein EEL49_06335 [Muribaculaceae bacterium Isolate-104 (HZI)]|jgi:hypothetical protein|nr:hypothetical protein EEL49_06335 [Muribaculaceae bacterium Isolate-104 (HZI)]